jgi:hypothetical protein
MIGRSSGKVLPPTNVSKKVCMTLPDRQVALALHDHVVLITHTLTTQTAPALSSGYRLCHPPATSITSTLPFADFNL